MEIQLVMDFTPQPVKKSLSSAQIEQRRAAARSRGRQLANDKEHQSRASKAQKDKWGGYWLSEWGKKGYVAQARASGFDTNFTRATARMGY